MVAQAMEPAWQRDRKKGSERERQTERVVDVTMRFSACMNKVTV